MALPQIAPRRIAPYLLSGVSTIHILTRMRRLSTHPAKDVPLHLFLLRNSDIVVVLVGYPIVWHFTRQPRNDGRTNADGAKSALISQIVHQLRQVFTNLLLGLGLIKRKVEQHKASEVPPLVDRLQGIVEQGIKAVNEVAPPFSGTNTEDELTAEA